MQYHQARKKARPVTVGELKVLAAADDNPVVYPGPRKRSRRAMNLRVRDHHNGLGSSCWDYCNSAGYDATGCGVLGTYYAPVFHFNNDDLVYVAPRRPLP